MMNVSVNNAGAIFNMMSTEKAVLCDDSVGAKGCASISSCIDRLTGNLGLIVSRTNNMSGVGNVNMKTPGNGFFGNYVRFTPGLP